MRLHSPSASHNQSSAHIRYTPSASQLSEGSPTRSIPMIPTTTTNHTGGSAGVTSGNGSPLALGSSAVDLANLWIIFGVKNWSLTSDIETILVFDQLYDGAFFSALKAAHRKYRWWLFRWLSPYRFRYCKFAQVCLVSHDDTTHRGNQRDHLTNIILIIV